MIPNLHVTKNRLLMTFRNWLVANLFAFVPILVFVLGWLPDKMVVDVRAKEDGYVSAVYNGKTLSTIAVSAAPSQATLSFYIPVDYDSSKVSVACASNDSQKIKLSNSRIEKYRMLSVWPDGSWRVNAKGMLFILLSELFLLILAVCGGGGGLWPAAGSKWMPCVCVSGIFAFAVGFVHPWQSFMLCGIVPDALQGDLLMSLGLRSVKLFLLTGAAVLALTHCFGRIVYALILALLTCLYLETGILSIGLGELNGDVARLRSAFGPVADTSVWFAVFVAAIVCAWRCRRNGVWLLWSGALFVMMTASLLDVKKRGRFDAASFAIGNFCSERQLLGSAEYSTAGNVILLILDSVSREEAHAAVTDPIDGTSLRKGFVGFTSFTNNIGMGPCSTLGVAGIMTGKYLPSLDRMEEYCESAFSSNSIVVLANQYCADVFALFGNYPVAYSSKVKTNEEDGANAFDLLRLRKGFHSWNLSEVTLFRCVPFALKRRLYWTLVCGRPIGDASNAEKYLYPKLSELPMVDRIKKTFLTFHTPGTHIPIRTDRNGAYIPGDDTFHGATEKTLFLFKQVTTLFEALRKRGLYDNATIVVTADHSGIYTEPANQTRNGLLQGARPFLMVKPPNAKDPFVESGIPTSHSRIFELLKLSLSHDVTRDEVARVLRKEERLFRLNNNGRISDRIVSADGSVRVVERDGGESGF